MLTIVLLLLYAVRRFAAHQISFDIYTGYKGYAGGWRGGIGIRGHISVSYERRCASIRTRQSCVTDGRC